MKNFILFCIVLAITSCGNKKEAPDMPGAYFMTSQTVNDGKKDTKYTDLKQLKIYTDSFFMYTQVNPSDSVSSFGLGTYTSDTGTVIENVIFSARDTTVTPSGSFKLNITKTPEGYIQVIPRIVTDSQSYRLTEEYRSVGTTETSPLDGIWKETDFYIVRGTDTSRSPRTQYKAFYKGYFMYGQSYKDSSNKNSVGIGFGTFKMDGDKRVNETDLNSTYSIAVGQTFPVDIELNGSDNYKQTIVSPDSSRSVELYQRLKK